MSQDEEIPSEQGVLKPQELAQLRVILLMVQKLGEKTS